MTPTTILRTARRAAAAILLTGSIVAGVASLSAGTALAPEPAKVATSWSGATGTTTAAIFVNSQQPTTVVGWSSGSSAVYAPNGPAAGTPCSPGNMVAGQTTTHVIQVLAGNYRRCV